MRTFLVVLPDETAIEAGLAAAPDVLVVDLAEVGGDTRPPPACGGEGRVAPKARAGAGGGWREGAAVEIAPCLPTRLAPSRGSALSAPGGGTVGAAFFARVSSLRSGAIDDELARAMQLGAAGILLSGAAGRSDVEQLGARLAVLEAEHGRQDGATRIVALVDTAQGVLSLPTMRPYPRLDGIAVDPALLAERLGCAPGTPAISQAAGTAILAAAACGVSAATALDRDHRRELAAAHEAGFDAVILDDPADLGRLSPSLRRPSAASSRTSSRASRRNTRDSRPA